MLSFLKTRESCHVEKSRGNNSCGEHRADTGHTIANEETKMLVRERRFWSRLYRKAVEIRKNPNNFNIDRGIG